MQWNVLVPLNERSEILAISPGIQPPESLPVPCRSIIRVAPQGEDGSWSAHRESKGATPTPIEDAEHLFEPDRGPRFDVVLWSGFPRVRRGASGRAGTWPVLESAARAVRPGGHLVFSVVNPAWAFWNPARMFLARIADGGDHATSPILDFGSSTSGYPRLGRRQCRRRLRELGFESVRFFHSFPNHRFTRFAVPLDHAGAVDYFLSHLLPRKTAAMGAAVGVARAANRVGLYRALVPVIGVVARKGESDGARGTA